MDRPDEHQRRWIAQKQPTPAQLEELKGVKESLQASLGAALQTVVGLAQRLVASDQLVELYDVVDRLAELSRTLARITHSVKAVCDWNIPPQPEFTDHFINLYYVWPELKRGFWLEGGVLCALAMKRGGRYLELCCGSGFNTDMFYAALAREIVAVDFDPRAIELARRHHACANVRYEVVDIRRDLPAGPFDGVIWDGAIEHFSGAEVATVMTALKRALAPEGLLSGYTVAKSADMAVQHPDHEQEFAGMADLGALLKPYFKNVLIFESVHPTITPARHNLFFFASDGVLPFDPQWPRCWRS